MENKIQPEYYKAGDMDVIDFCNINQLGFCAGNVVKYIIRAGKKENNSRIQDLLKAKEYISRLIRFENESAIEETLDNVTPIDNEKVFAEWVCHLGKTPLIQTRGCVGCQYFEQLNSICNKTRYDCHN